MVVGENLGTVPQDCRRAMPAHRVYGCYVAQWGISQRGLEPPPPDTVASIGTHDMAPFAAWWRGMDINERLELGLSTEQQASHDTAHREQERTLLVRAWWPRNCWPRGRCRRGEVPGAWLAFLAGSDARAVLVFLEDLWGKPAVRTSGHGQRAPELATSDAELRGGDPFDARGCG